MFLQQVGVTRKWSWTGRKGWEGQWERTRRTLAPLCLYFRFTVNIICLVNILIYKMSSVGLLFVAVTEYKKNNLVYFGMWFQSMVTWLCYWLCGSELHGGKHVAVERYSPYGSQDKMHPSKACPWDWRRGLSRFNLKTGVWVPRTHLKIQMGIAEHQQS